MSILEDLDLLDLPDVLPDDLDFSLDDILFEFSTPGLYDTAMQDEDPESFDLPFTEPAESEMDLPVEEEFPVTTLQESVPAEAAEADDGIKLHIPVDEQNEDDDVRIYDPSPSATPVDDETITFDIPDLSATTDALSTPVEEGTLTFEVPNDVTSTAAIAAGDSETITFSAVDDTAVSAAAAAEPAPKRPGFLQRLLALLPKKKAKKPVTEPVVEAPTEGSAGHDLLFSDADDELSVLMEAELYAAMNAEEEALRREQEELRQAEEIARLQAEEEARLQAELEAERSAALQAQLDAEREAFELAQAEEARQAEEAAILSEQAENELFAWIETSSSYRAKLHEEEVEALREASAYEEAAPAEPEAAEEPSAAEFDAAPMMQEEPLAPQIEYELPEDEQNTEDLSALLENPDIDPEVEQQPEEAPEEVAARKAKEDDELHYKPEDAPAKTVFSAITRRISGLFAAFTELGNTEGGDHEDALGPEVTPRAAYRHFSSQVSAYRFRLRISTFLCVILAWISLGLPVFGSLRNPAVAASMCLMILLTVMLAGADILVIGVRSLLSKRPGLHALVALSCVASVLDAVVIIISGGKAGYLPFCAISAISMCFAIYGSLLYCRSQRLNFKTLEKSIEPMTISVDYDIVDQETTTVYRTPGHPENYIHHSEEEDLSETVYAIITPVLTVAIPVMSLLAAILSKSFGDVLHIMAGMFAAAASFSAMLAFPLPYFYVQRDLYANKAAIAGWTGTREIGRVSSMIIHDRDLFPDETVSIKSIGIVDNVPPQLTLSYACSLIKKADSCLVPAFLQLADNHDCTLYDIEDFECHEAGGFSGSIGPDHVMIASHSYMKLQGLRLPIPKKKSENSLFLAVNGHVIAYFTMEYKAIKSVRYGLETALRGAVEIIFAARDFNITPLLLSQRFRCETETIRFPSYKQRFDITDRANSETATCSAVVYRKSFVSYAAVVEKARYLYKSVSWTVMLSALSTVIGVLLEFIMATIGAGAAISVGKLLIFMLLWLIPTVVLSVSITR